MAPDPGPLPRNPPVSIPGAKPEQLLFTRLAITSGLLAAAVSLLGLVSAHSGLIVLGGTSPNSRAIALSAALAWIVLGSVLAYSAARPFGRAARLAVQAVLFVIAALAATEFGFSVLGSHFFVETLFVQAGTVVLGPLSYPVSPVAAGLVAASAVALAALLRSRDHGSGRETWRTAMSIPGIAIALVSFTFVLSYAYGDPLLYGTRFIPIALLSALAAFFTGVAIVAAAGPGAAPARYLIGDSTSARLLRVFIPLVAAIIILENFAFVGLASVFGVRDVVLLSASLVVFLIVTAYVVARASGGIGKALDEAEAALAKKNDELANLNEELSATGEELRQTNDELVAHERRLVRQNEDLNAINEELTSTQEELRQTIDDLTRTETILRESEERFRSVLDSSRDFIYRLNLQTGIYEYVSPSVNYVLGYTPEEFAALDPGAAMERVHPDDLAAVNEGLKGLSETGSADMEYRLRTKSGEYRWVSNILSTVNDSAGRPLFRGGTVRDITRRKEAEEQIQATLQRFYHILSGMPYGILLVTDEDRVEFANQAFCDIFGLSDCPGELANITAARMMEKIRHAYRDPDAALARIREIVRNGEPVSGEDVPMSSGRVFLRDFLPVRLGEKRSGRLWIHVDITARRQAEEALRQSERRLARSQEISHLGSWELDLVNNRLAWSDEVYRIFGLRPQEFGATYEAFLAAVHPDDRAAVDAAYSGSLREGRDTYEIEHRVVRKDTGEIRYVHEKCEHQRDENGKIIRSVGMVHDITERKQAEDALREAEARFRLALKNAPVSVAVQDKNLVFRWAYNQRTRSTGEIVGKTDADLFAPEDMEWLLPLKHRVLETGSEVRAENWVTSNGQRVFLDLYLEPIRNPAGEITGIGIAAVNLTELKIAEDALREAQLRTTAILEGIADTFYSLDDQWRFTMVNPAAEKAPFGRPAADLLGRVIWDLYPELVGTKIHRHYLDAAKKGSMEHYESRSPLNGRWYEVFMKGQKGGVDVYMRDITGRRQAEEALRGSEEKYRNLFTNMTEEVHFWKLVRDGEGRIVTWRLVDANPPTLKTWGKTREEILGKTTDEIFGPGATGHYMPVVQKIMAEGVPYSFEDYFPNLDKYFRFTSVPFGDYFITTGADITGIKKAEIELRKKNEDLGSLNEEITATQEELHQNIEELSRREHELSRALAEKEVLLSEIHHRVKNNLTAFISLLSLEGSTEDTEAGKLLKLDLQNRARSMALIHETLYKTHMYDEVDMGMYLTTLVEQIANTFRTGRPVTTVVDAHGVMLDIPRATPAGLIVNELVTNSLKYAFPEAAGGKKGKKPAATITISLAKNDGEYVMAVKDNGAGLPPGFDLETTQTLGLKLVNFLARHQMRAKVEVRREKGTEFVFRFRE